MMIEKAWEAWLRAVRAIVLVLVVVGFPVMTFIAVPAAVVKVFIEAGAWSLLVAVPLTLLLWTAAAEAFLSLRGGASSTPTDGGSTP
ncbi:hypothetical protein OG874_00400 [Nocardia sp. NBC_00565]|uniref:hypothetical protein n=1 Tax=Nocardia sp. NBC_00565 TaxID=2975993 RepID=UPI002E7FDB0A|nr:hypothetical protein [Nocardia sp. NBC_00565]WUC03715.1 hypothetical protein OG874_00400 [Nocardia sp. NBC_00565]